MRLELSELEQLKQRVAGEYQECPIGDLESMIADAERAFSASPFFTSIAIHKTGSATHQIEVRCSLTDPATLPAAIATELTRIWTEQLAYDDFEAHALAASSTTFMLDYLTVAREPRIFATGMVVVGIPDSAV